MSAGLMGGPARADFFIRPDAPTVFPNAGTGEDLFNIETADGTQRIVKVTSVRGDDRPTKATKIQDALDKAGLNASVEGAGATAQVKVIGTKVGGFGVVNVQWKSGTGEQQNVIENTAGGGGAAAMTFEGTVTGFNEQGQRMSGVAGFTIGSVVAVADLGAIGTPGISLDAFVTNVYNDLLVDLPTELRSRLTLDLTSHRIGFAFPDVAPNPLVRAGATDVGLITSIAMTNVPEPSSLALLGIGLGGVALGMGQRRRLLARWSAWVNRGSTRQEHAGFARDQRPRTSLRVR